MEIAAGVEILPQNLQSLEDIGPEFHLHSIYVRINVWKTFTIFESDLTILFCVRVGTSRITVAPACEQRCFFFFFSCFPVDSSPVPALCDVAIDFLPRCLFYW